MASVVDGYIGKLNPGNGTEYAIGSTAYGYCETAAATAAKAVDMTGFTLFTGATVHIKFKYANSASNPTLNVNGTGAKPIYQYGTTAASTSAATTGWQAGSVLVLTYDGAGWIMNKGYNTDANTTYSAGTGLSLSGSTINHSNAVTAKTAYGSTATSVSANGGKLKVTDVQYDAQGHITASTDREITLSQKTYTASTSKLVTTTVPNVTSAGSAPSLTYAEKTVKSVKTFSAGSAPELTIGSVACDDITGWTANTPASAAVADGVLTLTPGTAADLAYTPRTVGSASGWSAGSVPTLTTEDVSCDDITAWDAGSAPTLGTAVTVATGALNASGSGASVVTGIS